MAKSIKQLTDMIGKDMFVMVQNQKAAFQVWVTDVVVDTSNKVKIVASPASGLGEFQLDPDNIFDSATAEKQVKYNKGKGEKLARRDDSYEDDDEDEYEDD